MKKTISILMGVGVVILLTTGCTSRGDSVASLSQGETWGEFLFEGTEEVRTGSTAYNGTTYVEAATIIFGKDKSTHLLPGPLGSKKINEFIFVWNPETQKVEIFKTKRVFL